MSTRLASFPFARNNQIPADAQTFITAINSAGPTQIALESEGRAYLLLRNTTSYTVRYFYNVGDYAVGFILKPQDTARIVNKKAVYVQAESGSGNVCYDIGIG